jgi:hypothetical protein
MYFDITMNLQLSQVSTSNCYSAVTVGRNGIAGSGGWSIGQSSGSNTTKDFFIRDVNNSSNRVVITTSGLINCTGTLAVNGVTAGASIGLTSNLPICVGNGSTSTNALCQFSDNSTGINFASGQMNLCVSGVNQAIITNGAFSVTNGTIFITSQTNIAADAAHHIMKSSNISRWGYGLKGTESSANAGSNFVIFNYADSGDFLSDALVITRSNNKFSIVGPLSLTTFTDDTNGNVTANTYTPTLTNSSNVNAASSTVNVHNYSRVGNMVTVSGSLNIVMTGAARFISFTLTLPYAPNNFLSTNDASGCGTGYDTGPGDFSGANFVMRVSATNAAKTVACIGQLSSNSNAILIVQYVFKYRIR